MDSPNSMASDTVEVPDTTEGMLVAAIEREFVALEDLPAFIHRLQDEVRQARAALSTPTEGGEVPVAFLMRRRMPGYEWREWTICSADDHAAIQKQRMHWGMECESMPVYARPTPAAAAGVPPITDEMIDAAGKVLWPSLWMGSDDHQRPVIHAMLESAFAVSGAPAGAPSEQKEDSVHQAAPQTSVPDGAHSGEAPASAPLAGGSE